MKKETPTYLPDQTPTMYNSLSMPPPNMTSKMALPKDIPMLTIMCRNLTRTNNVFISSDPIGHLAEHWKINQKSLTTSLLIPSSKSLYRTQYQPLCSTSDKLIVHSPS